jgi:hypothetical protein
MKRKRFVPFDDTSDNPKYGARFYRTILLFGLCVHTGT